MKRAIRILSALGIALGGHGCLLFWEIPNQYRVLPVAKLEQAMTVSFRDVRQLDPVTVQSESGPALVIPIEVVPHVPVNPIKPAEESRPVEEVSLPDVVAEKMIKPAQEVELETVSRAPVAPAVMDDQPVIIQASPLYATNQPPVYPRLARRRGLEGLVLLAVFVDAEGGATTLRISKSSGHNILDKAALKSVRRWKFQPGKVGSKPQPMWVSVPVRFKLHN